METQNNPKTNIKNKTITKDNKKQIPKKQETNKYRRQEQQRQQKTKQTNPKTITYKKQEKNAEKLEKRKQPTSSAIHNTSVPMCTKKITKTTTVNNDNK